MFIPQFIFIQHTIQFILCFICSFSVITINHKDQSLCVLEVMSPERTDLVLPSDVPDRERDVLVLDRLDVEAWGGRATRRSGGRGQGGATPSVSAAAAENPLARPGENRTARSEARRFRGRAGRTDRRDGRDDLAELELVEDGRLTWRSARDMGRVSEDTRGCLEAERREKNGSRARATYRRRRGRP